MDGEYLKCIRRGPPAVGTKFLFLLRESGLRISLWVLKMSKWLICMFKL